MASVEREPRHTKSLDVTYVSTKGLRQMKADETVTPKLQHLADSWKARRGR